MQLFHSFHLIAQNGGFARGGAKKWRAPNGRPPNPNNQTNLLYATRGWHSHRAIATVSRNRRPLRGKPLATTEHETKGLAFMFKTIYQLFLFDKTPMLGKSFSETCEYSI